MRDDVAPTDLRVTNKSFIGDSLMKESNSQGESEEKIFSIFILEVNLCRRITRNYVRQLRVLPTAPLLPRQRIRKIPVTEVGDVEVQTLEDLVYLAL